MKKLIFVTLISALFVFSSVTTKAQCLDFAKSNGFAKLDTSVYLPDGRLNAMHLSQGDNFYVYKAFFKGRKYKVVALGNKKFNKLHLKVNNFQRQVVFDSDDANTDTWEFEADKNQNLIITVEIAPAEEGKKPESGCVAILVGFSQN